MSANAVAYAAGVAAASFAVAVVLDIVAFGNYSAVPFHSAAALVAAGMTGLVWLLGKRGEQ